MKLQTVSNLSVKVRGKLYPFLTVNQASAIVKRLRDESSEGASTFGSQFPIVTADKKKVGHVSYNARVWDAAGNCVYPETCHPCQTMHNEQLSVNSK